MYTALLLENHFSVLKFWTSLPFQAQTAFPYVRFDRRCWVMVLTTNLYQVSHKSAVKHNLYCKAPHTVFVCTSALFVRMSTCSDSLNPKCHSSCQSRWVFMVVMEHSGSCFQWRERRVDTRPMHLLLVLLVCVYYTNSPLNDLLSRRQWLKR